MEEALNIAVDRPEASDPKAIWVTWERHRRTRELSRALGTELIELTTTLPRLARYLTLLVRTTLCIVRRAPSVVVVQCPSVMLGLWAACLKPVCRFTLVADLHNDAVRPYTVKSGVYEWLIRIVHRAADLCLVSNSGLSPIVERSGGSAFVLPDKLPDLTPRPPETADGGVAGFLPGTSERTRSSARVVFICTYAADEPYMEVIDAARALDPSVTIFVTGDHRKVTSLVTPATVTLTGFLPDERYVALLNAADVIVDLTRIDDCLVCGAYEAVALGKPLVTSDTRALREYFRLGTVYTKHDSQSLAVAITDALDRKDTLSAEMRALKAELAGTWTSQKDALRRTLGRAKHRAVGQVVC
jgi:glycosyltransferase involved in cell wall biosynthesis